MTRTELSDMIALADRLLGAGETAVLATLFCSDGSTYRSLGDMMVSGPGSVAAGGVSGGCVEEYVARHGRTLVQQGSCVAMLSFDADPDGDGGKPSLGCGGSIEVLVERMTAGHVEFLRRFRDAMDADAFTTAACVVDVSANGLPMSARRTWSPQDVGVDSIRLQAIESERSRHGVVGAGRRALVHYIPPLTRLVILGAGDDVRPLCTLARSLGWHVTVTDRRGRLATRARFPEADVVIAAEWANSVEQIRFTARTAVVMMTHRLADDVDALPRLADKPLAYLGALGPPHRREWVLERSGVTGNLAARFRGPIGLNLGDRSPSGIAVSVTSEILATLNARDATPLSTPSEWESSPARST